MPKLRIDKTEISEYECMRLVLSSAFLFADIVSRNPCPEPAQAVRYAEELLDRLGIQHPDGS